jgi:acetyltransferase-like isoleucine patch superfamily enzyme
MRESLKLALHLACCLVVLPEVLSYRLRAALMGADRAIQGSSQLLGLLPGLVGCYLRTAFYRLTLAEFHRTARVEFGTLFSKSGVRFGRNAYVGPGCHLGLVTIGDDALIAAGVHVPSGSQIHGIDLIDRPIRDQEGIIQRISIGNGAWIGANAVVMADVGANAIVAAGAVVTHPVPDWAVVAGVPARLVRMRREEASNTTSPNVARHEAAEELVAR